MQQRRRRILQAAAGTLSVGLAGCSDDGGSDGTDGTDGSDGSDDDTTATQRDEKVPPEELSIPVAGDPEAAVTVTVFEDLRCPHCADFNAEVYPRIESEYVDDGTIRYEHRDFPVVNGWSENYAYAGRSVQAQVGDEAFFAFAKGVFERQTKQTWGMVGDVAAEVGADADETVDDGESGTYSTVVDADASAGQERGVSTTPTVFVGDAEAGGSSWDELYKDIATKIDNRL